MSNTKTVLAFGFIIFTGLSGMMGSIILSSYLAEQWFGDMMPGGPLLMGGFWLVVALFIAVIRDIGETAKPASQKKKGPA